jgi:hypothetical protein
MVQPPRRRARTANVVRAHSKCNGHCDLTWATASGSKPRPPTSLACSITCHSVTKAFGAQAHGYRTALFTGECRSFLDNVIAGSRQIGAWTDPCRCGRSGMMARHWEAASTYLEPANRCCSVVGRLAASDRWRHSWQHAIESHAATDGGFIPGGRRSRVLSHSHSPALDIRTAGCRRIVIATRAAERPFQRAQATRRRGAGPASCGHPP